MSTPSRNGDYSKILDILAASMIFNSEEEIYNAVEKLKSETCFVNFCDRDYLIIGHTYGFQTE